MAKKSLIRKKLNSEKGVTGVDIVVSITMIIVTISVVMAIYVNINNTSRNVTRTAGATRIATNILEQIEIMYYEELQDKLQEMASDTANVIFTRNDAELVTYNGEYVIDGKKVSSTYKLFNTRVPTGYTVVLNISNVFGAKETSKFDIIKKIDISVKYNVAGLEKEVSLSTTKQHEKLNYGYNEPVISINNFIDADIINGFASLEFKYVYENSSGNFYTTSYEAVVNQTAYTDSSVTPFMIVTTGNVNVASKVIDNNSIYVWIPAHNIILDKIIYGYKSSDKMIKDLYLNDLETSANVMQLYTVKPDTLNTEYSLNSIHENAKEKDGVWVKVSDLNDGLLNGYYNNFWNKVNISSLK